MKHDHYFIIGVLIALSIVAIVGIQQAKSADDEGWKYEYGGLLESASNSYFLETGWREVEDWEIEQCSRKLSSEIESNIKTTTLNFESQSFSSGTSITLQALKSVYYGDIYYELAWYINPSEKNITFQIDVYDKNNPQKTRMILDSTKINQNEGRGFYDAFSDTETYTNARIKYDDGVFDTPFVDKKIK